MTFITQTQRLGAILIGVAIFSSCSRPTAYFQRGSYGPLSTYNAPTAQSTTLSAELPTPVDATSSQTEAYVRADDKLSSTKTVDGRMARVKSLLAANHTMPVAKATYPARKLNVVGRFVLKKLNRKIGKQLAPNNPEKTMIRQLPLIGGIVLLIGGLVLLIAGTGTAAFIGLIVALIGAVGVITGLFGI
ncbi:hypothetical protein [Spirosoma sp. KNUC1025]|uniref:hypothetical protein n=1 Tax=Spirosoma sp. KNUC1025 TaxID=2894082 RepID=UPI003865A9B3|nr:hypothetical protein LN737_20810 [Spirosoma sp. KNUC1025]